MIQITPYSPNILHLLQVFETDQVSSFRVLKNEDELTIRVFFRDKKVPQLARTIIWEPSYKWKMVLMQTLNMKRKRKDLC